VIPVAASLRKAGASKGAVASFTASTPQTGVDSIAATYSLMGLPFTIGRIAADLVSGLLAGTAINLLGLDKTAEPKEEKNESRCCCCGDSKAEPESEENLCCGDGDAVESCCSESKSSSRIASVLQEGFVTLPGDIGGHIFAGILLGALLSTLIPEGLLGSYLGNPLLTYALVTLVSVPVYVCATGSIPIAFGLIAAGLSPGAAIVFLVAGPATNTATITTLFSIIGKKETGIYLLSLLIGAWSVGYVFDQFGVVSTEAFVHMHKDGSWLKTVAGVVLALVLAVGVARKRTAKV
jgi:uncharacterized membrane protein YraQ (UPF0718 family)